MARGGLRTALALSALAAAAALPKHWGGPRFDGKRILVTGGDSGIGLAAVEAFYLECGSVLIAGHSPKKTEEAFRNVSALEIPAGCQTKPKLAWHANDVSKVGAGKELVDETVRQLGGLDVAVNNAGAANLRKDIDDDDFVDLFSKSLEMNVNVRGTLDCMHSQLRHWNSSKTEGVMVNVASIAGETAWAPPAYSTSKWAMIGFTKQAAIRYARHGIRINALAPGAVETPMLRDGLAPDDPAWLKRKAWLEKPIPMGRIGQPWEMAGPITFLASDMSSYLSGHVLTADGGITLANPWPELRSETPELAADDQMFVI